MNGRNVLLSFVIGIIAIMMLASAGITGDMVQRAASQDTDSSLPNTITINSTGEERVSYEFTVSGEVEYGDKANLAGDESNPTYPDGISGATASGSVAEGGVDNYRFSGELSGLSLTGGPAEVYVNGEQIDPSEIGLDTTPEPRIDASIVDFSPEESTYRSGDTQQAQVTVENTGNREHTYFVGYGAIGPGGEVFTNDGDTGRAVTIAAGEQRTVTVEWTVESDAPAGAYGAQSVLWKEGEGDLETRLDRAQTSTAFEVVANTPTTTTTTTTTTTRTTTTTTVTPTTTRPPITTTPSTVTTPDRRFQW